MAVNIYNFLLSCSVIDRMGSLLLGLLCCFDLFGPLFCFYFCSALYFHKSIHSPIPHSLLLALPLPPFLPPSLPPSVRPSVRRAENTAVNRLLTMLNTCYFKNMWKVFKFRRVVKYYMWLFWFSLIFDSLFHDKNSFPLPTYFFWVLSMKAVRLFCQNITLTHIDYWIVRQMWLVYTWKFWKF